MKRVVLYSSNKCPHCDTVKEYFKQHGIKYRLCNIQTPAGQKEFSRLNFKSVPVLKVGDSFMQAFTVKKFQQLFNK